MKVKENTGGRLLTEEELTALKDRLDLPDHVIDYLRHQPRLSLSANFAGIVVMAVLAGVLGAWPILIFSRDFAHILITSGFLPEDTLLYKQSGISLVLLMISGLPVAICMIYIASRFLPNIYYKSVASNFHQATESLLNAAIIRWFLKGIDRTLPSRKFLKRYEHQQTRKLGRIALILYGAGFMFFMLDIRSLNWVTHDGVRLSPYLSGRVLDYEWTDVVGVQTGCVRSSSGSRVAALQYILTFKDRRSSNLGTYRPVNTTRVGALEIVDGELAVLNVPKTRGVIDQRCLNSKRRDLGLREFRRMQRLL